MYKSPGQAWSMAWLVLLGAAMAQAAAQNVFPTGRLSGDVVDADTGAPIPAVRISVSASSSSSSAATTPRTALTDAAGRYDVTSLAAGSYVVTASKPTYVTAFFGRRHEIDAGGTVDLAWGQNRGRVDFQLSREAILAGRVVGTDGQGLAGLLIKVSRPHILGGRRQLVSFGSARSDAGGEYRVGGLLPGDYYMSVALFERSDSRAAKYAPTFYPASAEVATAIRIRLTAGATVRISPVTPLPVPWVRLSGRLRSSEGKLMRGALIMQPRDPDGLSLSPDAVLQMFPDDDRFTFDFVVPGHYIIRAHGSTGTAGPDLSASWSVDVEGKPVPEETMTLMPGSALSGVARFEAHGDMCPPADLAPIRLYVPLLDGTNFGAESEAHLRPDGTFHLTGIDAGQRLLRVDGLPFPWSLDRVMHGDRDATDLPMDLDQSQKMHDVEVVFTDVVTGLTGVVHNRAGAPVVNYMVVIFPVDRASWRPLSRHILATRTDWEGHYRLASLPPGEYRVAAVDAFEEFEIYERDTLDQISPRSVPAILTSGELRVQDLVVNIGQRSGGG